MKTRDLRDSAYFQGVATGLALGLLIAAAASSKWELALFLAALSVRAVWVDRSRGFWSS